MFLVRIKRKERFWLWKPCAIVRSRCTLHHTKLSSAWLKTICLWHQCIRHQQCKTTVTDKCTACYTRQKTEFRGRCRRWYSTYYIFLFFYNIAETRKTPLRTSVFGTCSQAWRKWVPRDQLWVGGGDQNHTYFHTATITTTWIKHSAKMHDAEKCYCPWN